ncbi:MAG: carboxypeptidase [Planctomycetota bacterium]|jgi:hypothetical protein
MTIAQTLHMAKIRIVIETQAARGAGTDEDPVRTVYQYWSLEGKLLAEDDSLADLKEGDQQ